MITAALLHNPPVVFFDEPLDGLDANAAVGFKALIQTLAREGKTIVYSSHILDVVERVCDRVIIIDKGRLLVDGRPEELVASHNSGTLERLFTKLTGGAELEQRAEDYQAFKTAQDPPPPAPTLGKTFNVQPVSGHVFIKPPPGHTLAGDSRPVAAHEIVAHDGGAVPPQLVDQLPQRVAGVLLRLIREDQRLERGARHAAAPLRRQIQQQGERPSGGRDNAMRADADFRRAQRIYDDHGEASGEGRPQPVIRSRPIASTFSRMISRIRRVKGLRRCRCGCR